MQSKLNLLPLSTYTDYLCRAMTRSPTTMMLLSPCQPLEARGDGRVGAQRRWLGWRLGASFGTYKPWWDCLSGVDNPYGNRNMPQFLQISVGIPLSLSFFAHCRDH